MYYLAMTLISIGVTFFATNMYWKHKHKQALTFTDKVYESRIKELENSLDLTAGNFIRERDEAAAQKRIAEYWRALCIGEHCEYTTKQVPVEAIEKEMKEKSDE